MCSALGWRTSTTEETEEHRAITKGTKVHEGESRAGGELERMDLLYRGRNAEMVGPPGFEPGAKGL